MYENRPQNAKAIFTADFLHDWKFVSSDFVSSFPLQWEYSGKFDMT